MKKSIFLFLITLLLIFTSCSKVNVIDETKEEDKLLFEVIPRDTISVDIDVYPDAYNKKTYH